MNHRRCAFPAWFCAFSVVLDSRQITSARADNMTGFFRVQQQIAYDHVSSSFSFKFRSRRTSSDLLVFFFLPDPLVLDVTLHLSVICGRENFVFFSRPQFLSPPFTANFLACCVSVQMCRHQFGVTSTASSPTAQEQIHRTARSSRTPEPPARSTSTYVFTLPHN